MLLVRKKSHFWNSAQQRRTQLQPKSTINTTYPPRKRDTHWNSTCSQIFEACFVAVASNGTRGEIRRSFSRAGLKIRMLIRTLQQAKRFLKILFGFTLLALGFLMIFTPGPGWLTILLALGVLAAEFVWARRLLDRLKLQTERIRDAVFPPADRAA